MSENTIKLVVELNKQYIKIFNDIKNYAENTDTSNTDGLLNSIVSSINEYLVIINDDTKYPSVIYLKENSGDIVQLCNYNPETDKTDITEKIAIIIYKNGIYIGSNMVKQKTIIRPIRYLTTGLKSVSGYIKIATKDPSDATTPFVVVSKEELKQNIYTNTERRVGGGIKNMIDVFSKKINVLNNNKKKTIRKKKLKRCKSCRIRH